MRKFFLAVAILAGSLTLTSQALDLKDLINNANLGDAVSGVVGGLLTKSDITVEEMAGTWTATGSAVCFQSENFLQKAGGAAAAGTIESKLNPYYEKYGLTGSVLKVEKDGTFTLKVKSLSLPGTIAKRSDGNFEFEFKAFGKVKIGTIKAYVEKPISGLNVMFDATKLKKLLTTITSLTGNSLATSAGKILDSYDGLCVGFAFKGNGSSSSSTSGQSTNNNSGSDVLKNAGNALKGLFGK